VWGVREYYIKDFLTVKKITSNISEIAKSHTDFLGREWYW
jgi:hypothetical protein